MSKSIQISANLPADLRDQVNQFAQKENRTFSQAVVILLEFALKEKNRKRRSSKSTEDAV